ncbi:polymer-forming cytoskeletal protein [Chitinophaga rhizophila]|uniref:Polymer-forming cytoskeletal protein n=1 Tax=Chitinophaga rhizophila TaxID=2866212 RepID=A0ABS7GKV4_9BACT|nr:polymer-forming cytoskeletal protein [Chitinophaga rhizophila]MBW8688338.1 polymer-forming cytoskeletal protein [Chitinophaga rhizophila]
METAFDIISVTDAIKRYGIDNNMGESPEMFADMVAADQSFLLYSGDLVIDTVFLLHTETLPEGVAGYVIDGNLHVNGNIINEEGDYGPTLYVTGNVTCRSLLIGGSPVHIKGDVTAEEVIMLHYNHGWMKCPGTFTAPVMIVDDYHFIPEKKNITQFYYNDNDPDSPEANDCFETDTEDFHIAAGLQALLDNKQTTTFEELRYDLTANEYVLRPTQRNSQYWHYKVAINYRDLKRVPAGFRSLSMCINALARSVSSLAYFPEKLLTPDLIRQAVNMSGMALRYLPESYITKELCYEAVTKGAILDIDIPERFFEDRLLHLLIRHSDFQMERIPVKYVTEDLLVTYVKAGRGAWLDKYCTAAGVSKQRVLQRTIADGIRYLENIFGWHFSAETYSYARSIYDNDTYASEWAGLMEKYKKKLERLQ